MPFTVLIAPLIALWVKYKVLRVVFLFSMASILIYAYNRVFEYFVNLIFTHLDITNYLTDNALYIFIESGALQAITTYLSIVMAWSTFIVSIKMYSKFMPHI